MDLSGVAALDLAIGLAFIFFLLATLASSIQELIASFLGLRARTLEQGLRSLLENPKNGWKYVDDFYDHELIRSLYRTRPPELGAPDAPAPATAGRNWGKQDRGLIKRALAFFKPTRGPSYLSPRSFATAALDVLGEASKAAPETKEDLDKLIAGLPKELQARLNPLVKAAEEDVGKLRHQLEAWYDDTMARVSGWYKRKTQIILLVIGAALVLALNANTITLTERLWKDQAVRSAVVQASAARDPNGGLDATADSVDGVLKLGVPVGWPSDAGDPRHVSFTSWRGGLTAVLGWLLTLAAISFGAPFWFDALSKFSRLRSSGKPETPLPASAHGQANERVRD